MICKTCGTWAGNIQTVLETGHHENCPGYAGAIQEAIREKPQGYGDEQLLSKEAIHHSLLKARAEVDNLREMLKVIVNKLCFDDQSEIDVEATWKKNDEDVTEKYLNALAEIERLNKALSARNEQ